MVLRHPWALVLILLISWQGRSFGKDRYGNIMVQDSVPDRHSDSLLQLARNATDREIKFERYLDLSLYWSELDTVRAYAYLGEARKSLGPHINSFHQGVLLQYSANVVFANDLDRALSEYLRADSLLAGYRSPRAYQYRSKLWNNYAILMQVADSSVQYMSIIIDKVIPYAQAAKDSMAVANALMNIGLAMMNANDYENADQYYQRAIRAFAPLAHSEEGRFTANVLAARNAIFSKRLQEARAYLDAASQVFNTIPYSLYGPHYYRTEGSYYRHIKDRDRALSMFQKAIDLGSRNNNDQILRDIYFEEYALYRDLGEFAKAKEKLVLANRYGDWAGLQDRMLHIREMAKTEYRLGNFREASDLFENYLSLDDSLYGRDYQLKVAQLEKRYRTLEKEKKILELNAANQEHRQSLDRTKRWLILALSVLAVTVSFAFFWRKLARNNKRMLQQKEELYTKEMQVAHTREQLGYFQTVVRTQEEERNRMARDLHDGLGGRLAGIKLKLSTLAIKVGGRPEPREISVDHVISDLDHATDELRRIARNLMPESLLSMGLSAALVDLCQYLGQGPTKVSFQAFGLRGHYPREMAISVFRIVTELLNNALKHANASRIIVQCEEEGQVFFLTVEDDGDGFAVDEVEKGLGLTSVRNRVAVLGGTLEMDSEIGSRTTVTVEIPIPAENNSPI